MGAETAPTQTTQKGAGDSDAPAGTETTPETKPGETPPGEADDKFVTRETLQGSQQALRRALADDAKKSQSSMRDDLSKLIAETLDERLKNFSAPDPKKKSKGDVDDDVDSETAKVLRKHQDAIDELVKVRADLTTSQANEKDFRFRTRVMDSLQKLGCKKPEYAFKIISEHLQLDENDPNRVFAKVKTEWGDEDMELDDYLLKHVRDEMIPELFEGVNKPGSPAGGDSSGSHYLFTKEQIGDPTFYMANKDKIREALQRGLVKGIGAPGSA